MIKLTYLANIRLPTEKAHGIQIIKMCEALSSLEVELSLVAPRRFNAIKQSPLDYYNVEKKFSIKRLPVVDLMFLGSIGFWVEKWTFALSAFFFVLTNKTNLVFTRDELLAVISIIARKKTVWESHTGAWNWAVRFLVRRKINIVVISGGLKDFYIEKGVPSELITVSPDGVDLKMFEGLPNKAEARRLVFDQLPKGKPVVLYTGHLYSWKGVDVVAKAAVGLPEATFCFIGGTKKDQQFFSKKYDQIKNIYILGHQKHKLVPTYLKAADVLVLPNIAENKVSSLFTSPLKLFEYMASGTPIVASSLPSIKEILTNDEALFFKPGDVQDLTRAIKQVLCGEKSQFMAIKALEKVKIFDWKIRASAIINLYN